MSVSFSIFGACVSRDIFPANDKNYTISRYVSFSSPMSAFQKAGKQTLSQDELSDYKEAAFSKRCLLLDFNKTAFDYLFEVKSDYFILDILDSRMDLLQKDTQIVTYANIIRFNIDKFESFLPGIKRVSPFSFSIEQWYACMDWLCEKILEQYRPRQIILHEYRMALDYIDKDGTLQKCKDPKKNNEINIFIQKLYDRCENNLKGCHIVRSPDKIPAFAGHKWGLHPLHFYNAYYEYAHEAIGIITGNGKKKKKRRTFLEDILLKRLLKKYNSKCEDDREILLKKTYEKNISSLRYESKKLTKYSNHFLYIIQNYENTMKYIEKFCREKDIHSIALWGDFLVSQALAFFLNKNKISLSYIVSNWNNHTAETVYPTDSENFPPVDAVVICDVMANQMTIQKIASKFSCPTYFIYDILPMESENK